MVPECAYEKRVHLSHPHQFFAASDAYSDYQAVDSEGDTQRVSDNRKLCANIPNSRRTPIRNIGSTLVVGC